MNNIMVSDNIKIENMIYEIRGKKVMLDSDLAKLYNVETKRINEAVKNNIEKFPERYCFKLNDKETNNLRSKNSTSKINGHGGRRYNQRVFTEQGVYMLATILKSKLATSINKYIDDIFYSITGLHGLRVVYNSNISNLDKNMFIEKLKNNFNREIQYKMTFIGPNRDDFYFELDGKNLSIYGSQGQIRSAVIALKLAEVNLFSSLLSDSPILLLDDIFSELDIVKRNNILKYLNNDIQVIITTTDIENIDAKIREKANVYKIENGNIISREII